MGRVVFLGVVTQPRLYPKEAGSLRSPIFGVLSLYLAYAYIFDATTNRCGDTWRGTCF